MSTPDLQGTLRTLLRAAVRFEKVAAHHQRIEGERRALQDAITAAELVLSVTEPHQERKRQHDR